MSVGYNHATLTFFSSKFPIIFLYHCRMKKHKLNWNLYPDGISNSLTVFDNLIWDRAYYLETDDGVWYEMYVNDLTKSEKANIDEDIENEDLGLKNSLEGFHALLLDHY